jgi:hypothetical protein
MNRTTPRKQALVAAGNKAAAELSRFVGSCEWCGRDRTFGGIVQHEILGGSIRTKARLEPSCVLVLCGECHVQIHRLPMPERVLIGLAILYHARTSDYSLSKFIEIACPTAPRRYTQYEVDIWILRIAQ